MKAALIFLVIVAIIGFAIGTCTCRDHECKAEGPVQANSLDLMELNTLEVK